MFGKISNEKEPGPQEALVTTTDFTWLEARPGLARLHRPDIPPMPVAERVSRWKLLVMETVPQILPRVKRAVMDVCVKQGPPRGDTASLDPGCS